MAALFTLRVPTFRTLSIIIPAYNEERTIHLIMDKVRDVELHHGIRKEVIIVNDGSKEYEDREHRDRTGS